MRRSLIALGVDERLHPILRPRALPRPDDELAERHLGSEGKTDGQGEGDGDQATTCARHGPPPHQLQTAPGLGGRGRVRRPHPTATATGGRRWSLACATFWHPQTLRTVAAPIRLLPNAPRPARRGETIKRDRIITPRRRWTGEGSADTGAISDRLAPGRGPRSRSCGSRGARLRPRCRARRRVRLVVRPGSRRCCRPGPAARDPGSARSPLPSGPQPGAPQRPAPRPRSSPPPASVSQRVHLALGRASVLPTLLVGRRPRGRPRLLLAGWRPGRTDAHPDEMRGWSRPPGRRAGSAGPHRWSSWCPDRRSQPARRCVTTPGGALNQRLATTRASSAPATNHAAAAVRSNWQTISMARRCGGYPVCWWSSERFRRLVVEL